MHYLAYVRIDGFYVEVQRQLGVIGRRGTVVHRNKCVLDADSVARDRRIQPGMGLSEARALLEGGTFVKFEEEPYRRAREKVLDALAELTHALEPLDMHTALLDLSGHPRPDDIVRRLQEQFPRASVGVGRSRWVAEATVGIRRPDPTALHDALVVAGFPVESMLPVDGADRARLRFLGYHTVGEVAELPLSVLRAQFGEAGHTIHRAARGGGDAHVAAQWPPRSTAAHFAFEGSAEAEEVLRNGLRTLAKTLSDDLDQRDLHGSHLAVNLETEAGPVKIDRTFARPIQTAGAVYTALSLAITPLPESPVISIRARMPNLLPAKRIQMELEGSRRSRRDRQDSVDAAFRHIRTVYGDGSVQVASQVAEPRRKQVLRAWKDATGWA